MLLSNPNIGTEMFRVLLAPVDSPIEEDSTLRKVATVLPVIGPLVQMWNERLLSIRIAEPNSISRAITLLKVKNDYKIAGIIRDILIVATFVTLIALGILTPGSPLMIMASIGLGISALYIGFQLYNLHKNKQTIERLANLPLSTSGTNYTAR